MFNSVDFAGLGKTCSNLMKKAPDMLKVGGEEGAKFSGKRIAVAGAATYGTLAAGENLFGLNKNQ